MNPLRFLLTASVFLAALTIGHAQKGTVSAGIDATGTGGAVSISIGQIHQATRQGNGFTATEGLQQPYEFYTVGIDNPSISLQISVYPNPTRSEAVLRTGDLATEGLSFTITDMDGKGVREGSIEGSETVLDLGTLPGAVYLISVHRSGQVLETIKIIKNQ